MTFIASLIFSVCFSVFLPSLVGVTLKPFASEPVKSGEKM